MNKKIFRGLACMLCILLLLPVMSVLWSIPAAATEAEGRRFIFSVLRTAGEKEYPASSAEPLVLTVSAQEHEFRADSVTTVATDHSTNAVYLSLINTSNATRLRISYGYMESEPKSFSIEQALTPRSAEKQSFVLPAPHVAQNAYDLTLTFLADGELTGTVTLESLFDVSVYAGTDGTDNTPEGCYVTLEKCVYNTETGMLDVKGTLSFDAMVRYTGLAFFSLGPGEELYLSNKTPLVRMGVSNFPEFSVAINSAEEEYARYVLAGITESGEREPLCTPVYPGSAAKEPLYETGFKGYHTASAYSVINAGAGVSVVDVYLDKLQGDRNNGILYAGDHSYYYYDESYVESLDNRIRNLSGAGCSVYLRFLISPDVNGLPFVTYTEESGEIRNKGIAITSEEALLSVYAFTDFLTQRYTGDTYGGICGVILGRRADEAASYGYVGSMGLAEYTELYARTLTLVAGVARANDPKLRIVVPMSDRMWPETATPANLNGDYFAELFLLSLLEALSTCNLTPPEFSVMVESCDIPDQMAKTRQSGYGTDRLSLLTDVIGQYALRYGCLDTRVLYVWTPTEALSESELACAYALQYVSLFLHRDVASFIVDFSANAVGAGLDVGQLYRLISVIDTQEGDTALASVCTALRIEDLTDLFPDYRAGMLQERRTVQTSLSDAGYAEGRVPIGSYDLWDFSDATGTMGWYAGNACGELAVLGRALNAPFSPIGAGGFADMAYHFTSGRDLSVAPLLRMQIGVDGEADTPYEVQIRMIGAGVSVTAFAVLTAGDAQQLYLDLTESASLLTSVQCIRIAARPLNNSDKPFTVRLQSVTLESVILTSAELAERMEADGAGDPNGADGNKNGIATRAVIVTVLVIGVSIAFACMLIVLSRHHGRVTVTAERSDNEEKKEKKKDKDELQEGEAAPSEQEAAANRSENNKGRIKQ